MYSSSGIYVDTLQTINGCDSIVSLDLTLNYSSYVTNTIISCDEYTWIDGLTYHTNTDSAIYILNSSNGCDRCYYTRFINKQFGIYN